ncbi:NUDIX hydrolase [Thecamonas trahens ATCC 50062]|uniref:Oxidized purine nucleoside triphosphate hydrolase n=1 Tax=Thecamonas trahens ATCC 50062 TaxID=461836 RepID=A0A0L0D8B7_THETB|nr:NUDIX hydrolase [Thecamonas trahens ATCC 50062]KNC48602.1 NUDIX hydrolase [Thecamonas trahens ATCC 50062]|eukprot:XP_013762658.1 NUDIX hydrolase [Thecamonas trahens ATCC 50062]
MATASASIGVGRAGVKHTTLVYLVDQAASRILLALKKRGMGAGKVNGPGGKADVSAGDTSIRATAIRETQEEMGITPTDLQARGLISFVFTNDGEHSWDNDCTIFFGTQWDGEPTESDEMAPEWHPLDAVPYDRMWPDDELWLPDLLAGKEVYWQFTFDGDAIVDSASYADLPTMLAAIGAPEAAALDA